MRNASLLTSTATNVPMFWNRIIKVDARRGSLGVSQRWGRGACVKIIFSRM